MDQKVNRNSNRNLNRNLNRNQRSQKAKKWPWILGSFTLIIAAAVIYLPSLMPAQAVSNVESVQVMKGSIAETVVGTGTLADGIGDETEIKIPEGIRINEIFFDIDDNVSKDDVMATVDPLSLLHRIAFIRNEINTLDADIHQNKNDDGEEIVRTGVGGRVKNIFVEKGDSVSDIMNEHGVLMMISIDGKMAVDIESEVELVIGDNVTVVRENGSRRTGEVAAVNSGLSSGSNTNFYIITLSDNGPKVDEVVEIQDRQGNVIGTGVLYINQPIGIVAPAGTVKTIHVSENESISRNRRLMTLENVPLDAEFLQMLEDRTDLVRHLNELMVMAETHSIKAVSDGIVTGVYVFENELTSSGIQTATQAEDYWITAFTLHQNDDVVFSIEVDELDILSIQVEQDATIVFNALPDKQFIGSINEIASSSHSQSGVAKYSVEVSLAKDESMRLGMNATATIHINNKEDILVIPLEALQEFAGGSFVFTETDEQTGMPSGIRPVQTGVSNGMIVEITEGLTEGETVYFATRNSNPAFGFGPGGGGMPGRAGMLGGAGGGNTSGGGR